MHGSQLIQDHRLATYDRAVVWLHGSPAFIANGDWVVPATQLGGRSRTHPDGYGESELQWYEPDRVYIFDSLGIDPTHHLDRFGFVRRDFYLYEVEPQDIGTDADFAAATTKSVSCARARVLRCVHVPER